MEKIKKEDFIEIDYIGRIKNTGKIFDLTDEKVAKEEGIFNEKFEYGPVIICVGEGQILKGLDDELVGKEVGKMVIEVDAESAFGRKNAKLIKLVSINAFRKEKINPYPGLQVNVNGLFGLVRTVTGGRVMVDFNHPLAGKDVAYEVSIKRFVKDAKEKLESLVKLDLMQKKYEVKIENEKAEIKIKKLTKDIEVKFKERVKRLIPELKELVFLEDKAKEA